MTLGKVWLVLAAMTAVEVALAFQSLAPVLFLIVLLVLSVGKAVLIAAYYMHLRLAPLKLSLMLFPILIVMIGLLLAFLPDSLRMGAMRTL